MLGPSVDDIVPLLVDTATRPIAVAIVAPTLKKVVGGQEVQADLLVRAWQSDRTVSVIFVETNKPLAPWAEAVPYFRTALRFPLYLKRLATALSDAEVAHIFAAASWSFRLTTVPAYFLARILHKKVIIHYHSPKGERHLRSSFLARTLLRSADVVVVPSNYYVNVFREYSIAAHCIPNLVDADLFSYRLRRHLKPVLLSVRNFDPHCGVDIAIRAFVEIKREVPDAQLIIVGTGPAEPALRRLVSELNLTDVEFHGRVPRQQMGSFYDQADILINASQVDNAPVSILEAQASGLPVVTTGPAGVRALVDHGRTGLVSEIDNYQHLAQNALRLLEIPELAVHLNTEAYRQISSQRWDVVRRQWLDLYRQVQSNLS